MGAADQIMHYLSITSNCGVLYHYLPWPHRTWRHHIHPLYSRTATQLHPSSSHLSRPCSSPPDHHPSPSTSARPEWRTSNSKSSIGQKPSQLDVFGAMIHDRVLASESQGYSWTQDLGQSPTFSGYEYHSRDQVGIHGIPLVQLLVRSPLMRYLDTTQTNMFLAHRTWYFGLLGKCHLIELALPMWIALHDKLWSKLSNCNGPKRISWPYHPWLSRFRGDGQGHIEHEVRWKGSLN